MLTVDLFSGLDMSMFRNFCAWCQLKYEEKKNYVTDSFCNDA